LLRLQSLVWPHDLQFAGDVAEVDVDPDDRLLAGINQKEVGRLRLAARRLVTTSRREIATIAAALLRHGTLTADEIVGALASDRRNA
jgi:hypothetical protein